MQSLLPDDLYWVRRRLSRPVVQLMKRHAGKAVIAGGFIRSCVSNELINDIDIFAPTQAEALAWANELTAIYNAQPGFGNAAKVHVSQNAYTIVGIKTTVQIIHRWTYEKPEDIIGSFDFTIARAAMWWEPLTEDERKVRANRRPRGMRWKTMLDDRFYADLAARRLIYCSPIRNEDAGGSMLRVLKFYQRGFRIPLPSLGSVIARLAMGVDWKNKVLIPGELREVQEDRAAKVLSGLLREVDPAIDPDHIMHLPTPDEEGDETEDEASPPPADPASNDAE